MRNFVILCFTKQRYQKYNLQLWRLITNFLIIGKPSINFLFQLVWLYVSQAYSYFSISISIITILYPSKHSCSTLITSTKNCRVRYGAAYEGAKFGGNTADALTMTLFSATSILIFDLLIPPLRAFFHGQSLIFTFVYLWSRHYPDTNVGFFGVVQFKAVYLPFMLMGLDLVQGGSIAQDVIGILAGHLYLFLTEAFPHRYGWTPIKTPTWL